MDLIGVMKKCLEEDVPLEQAEIIFGGAIKLPSWLFYAYMYQYLVFAIMQQEERVESLKSLEYKDYLKTPEWKYKAEIVKRLYGKCQLCGDRSATLSVHHNYYGEIPTERLPDLVTLCDTCHKWHHRVGCAG